MESGRSCGDYNAVEGSEMNVDDMDLEAILPGFRFHPTDEELVGFYLKRKINHRPLSVELIKQLDIYKHDPWDLPKMATAGEKEWYFFCPRDRKYRNSSRPNRVTGGGFWKATGTDRPVYSTSEGNGGGKCIIGLKKSLVYYRGRAAKGTKTDWMMHEFRMPSVSDHRHTSAAGSNRTISANDAWAICRIFKKTSSTNQRSISHSWVSPWPHHDQAIIPNSTTSPHHDNTFSAGSNHFEPSHLSQNQTFATPLPPQTHQQCPFEFDSNSQATSSLDQQSNNLSSLHSFGSSIDEPTNDGFQLATKPSSYLHNSYPLGHQDMPSSSQSPMLLGDFKPLQGGDRESIGSSGVDQLVCGASQRGKRDDGLMSIQQGGVHRDHNGLISLEHGGVDRDHDASMKLTRGANYVNVDAHTMGDLGDITSPATWRQNLLLWDYLNSSTSPCLSDSEGECYT